MVRFSSNEFCKWHDGTLARNHVQGGGKDEQLCSIGARILQSHGLNYSSREIAVFSVLARLSGEFLGRVSRAGTYKGEMLKLKIIKNNWGKLLFCIELFSNFAPVNKFRGEVR